MNRVMARRLVDIQLNGARDAWHIDGGAHVRLTFWWDDVPLGHVLLDREQLPLGPPAVGVLAARSCALAVGWWTLGAPYAGMAAENDRGALPAEGALPQLPDAPAITERLAAALAIPAVNGNTLSVVICTRDRADSLARSLTSLAASQVVPGEVIVVDNAPRTNATREVVAGFPWVRYVLEPRPGLSHARNAGLAAASREVVAFTDDDVEVMPTWTTRLLQGMGGVDALTGQVLPATLDGEAQLVFEEVAGGFSQGYRPLQFDAAFMEATCHLGMPVWRIGAGANMALRREAIARIGAFDPRLGAGASGCSEDSEWWYRLLAAGGVIRYEPRAVVRHHHRAHWDELQAQMRAYMRGHLAALFVQWKRHRHAGNLRRAFLTIPAYLARGAAARVLRGPDRPRSTLGAEVHGTLEGMAQGLRMVLRRSTPE